MRVLIVEDEKPLRDSIVEQLQQHGFNVDAAADGEEGLYCGREYALDLAIVDLGLPKLNGMELIKKLRAEGKSYPVLILTARDKWQDKVEGLQAGADDYLAKPFISKSCWRACRHCCAGPVAGHSRSCAVAPLRSIRGRRK